MDLGLYGKGLLRFAQCKELFPVRGFGRRDRFALCPEINFGFRNRGLQLLQILAEGKGLALRETALAAMQFRLLLQGLRQGNTHCE